MQGPFRIFGFEIEWLRLTSATGNNLEGIRLNAGSPLYAVVALGSQSPLTMLAKSPSIPKCEGRMAKPKRLLCRVKKTWNFGIGKEIVKLVVVTQWVRKGNRPSPTRRG